MKIEEGQFRGLFDYIVLSELTSLAFKTYGNFLLYGVRTESILFEVTDFRFRVYFDFLEKNEDSLCNSMTFNVYEEGDPELLEKYLVNMTKQS